MPFCYQLILSWAVCICGYVFLWSMNQVLITTPSSQHECSVFFEYAWERKEKRKFGIGEKRAQRTVLRVWCAVQAVMSCGSFCPVRHWSELWCWRMQRGETSQCACAVTPELEDGSEKGQKAWKQGVPCESENSFKWRNWEKKGTEHGFEVFRLGDWEPDRGFLSQ